MKFGRLPRKHNSRIPHFSAFTAGRVLVPAPITVDWTTGMNPSFGMMLNDQLGDCTCAAVYHALQVWSFNALKKEDTEPDSAVGQLYEEACGWDGKMPPDNTDQGGVEQDVLTYLLNTGAPLSSSLRNKLLAFFEVDPRNLDDVRRVIYECGGIYIGFNVPDTIWSDGNLWHTTTSQNIIGGHAVWCPAASLSKSTIGAMSWGSRYDMSFDFWNTYVDECYALVDPSWVANTGMTPLGMSVADLEAAMQALQYEPPND